MYSVPMSDRINFKIMIQIDVWIISPSTAVFQYDKHETVSAGNHYLEDNDDACNHRPFCPPLSK